MMAKYWKLIVCMLAVGAMCACEKNEDIPGGANKALTIEIVNNCAYPVQLLLYVGGQNSGTIYEYDAQPQSTFLKNFEYSEFKRVEGKNFFEVRIFDSDTNYNGTIIKKGGVSLDYRMKYSFRVNKSGTDVDLSRAVN